MYGYNFTPHPSKTTAEQRICFRIPSCATNCGLCSAVGEWNRMLDMMDGMLDKRDWQAFSLAESLGEDQDPSWERPKALGNEALKRGEYGVAAGHFKRAHLLALGAIEGGTAEAFANALLTWPEGSPQREVGELDDIMCTQILNRLWSAPRPARFEFPSGVSGEGETWTATKPNRAAAIALANRAQAFLLAGQPERALSSAKRAVKADPSYVKGHFRCQRAHEALGDHKAAEEKAEEISDFNMARRFMPSENQALLTAGWITWEEYMLVWKPARLEAICSHLMATLGEGERSVEVRASLVPFQGGQGMILSLAWGPTTAFKMGKIDAADFIMTDPEHGSIADRPPNGHASEKTLENAPGMIGIFILELTDVGLAVQTLMIGQGLYDHKALVADRMLSCVRERAGETLTGESQPNADGSLTASQVVGRVFVYQADSTAASEDAGIPPRHSRESMRAKMLLMGINPDESAEH